MYKKMGGYRMDGRGSSPYKYRNYQDGIDYDQKEENFTNDPRVFFSQKPSEEIEKDSNNVQSYYTNKYRKLLEREVLKKNIEEDIYKVNPQLDHYILNRLIKIRLVFEEKQSNEQTQNNEDIFQFEEIDLKRFFSTFGKIEKIVIKDKCVSYVFFQDLVSAFCAQRAMNNFPLEDLNARLEIQLCVEDPEEENENKLIGHFMHEAIKDQDYMIRINSAEDERQLKQFISKYKYTNIFTMEINDPEFHLKERIMGASASNFYRLFYLCEKNSVETGHGKQNSHTGGEDLVIQLDQAKEMRIQQQQNNSNNANNMKATGGGVASISTNTNTNNNNPNTNNNNNNNNISNNKVGSGSNLSSSVNQSTSVSSMGKNKLTSNSNNSNTTGGSSNTNIASGNNNNASVHNQSEDITFRMIINQIRHVENEVLILSNNLEKYNTAVRYMHELLAQVNEEYRRFCEFQKKVNPGPLHIKRIEKFNLEPELMFISTKDMMNKNAQGKEFNIQKGDGSDKGGGSSSQFSLTFLSNNTNNQSMQIEQQTTTSSSTMGSGGGGGTALQDIQQKLQF